MAIIFGLIFGSIIGFFLYGVYFKIKYAPCTRKYINQIQEHYQNEIKKLEKEIQQLEDIIACTKV